MMAAGSEYASYPIFLSFGNAGCIGHHAASRRPTFADESEGAAGELCATPYTEPAPCPCVHARGHPWVACAHPLPIA